MSKEEKVVTEVTEVENSGVGTYKFKKPTIIDGEKREEINYDLSQVTGLTLRRAKAELQKRAYTVAVKELDEVFHAAIFAEITGLTIENVESFSAVDYLGVANIVRDFLMGED